MMKVIMNYNIWWKLSWTKTYDESYHEL